MEETGQKSIIQRISVSFIENSRGKIPVTVKVKNSTEILKWAEGKHEGKYFEMHGNGIDKGRFLVDRTGDYTVFAKDKGGNSEVQAIAVKYALPFFVGPVAVVLILAVIVFLLFITTAF